MFDAENLARELVEDISYSDGSGLRSDARSDIAAALTAAYRAGQEDMRERALVECEAKARGWVNGAAATVYGQAYQAGCSVAASAIRALEIQAHPAPSQGASGK